MDPLAIELDEDRALRLLTSMVQFDSRTRTAGESDIVGWLVDELAALGLTARAQPFGGGRANAVGVWPGTGEGESLMFNGHVDTNPVTEGWTVDPWAGLVRDGFVYGIGVSNMKAGCASYLEAVRTLLAAGARPGGDVTLSFVVGELQHGVGTRALIEDGYRADHFVNCEPTDLAALTTHAGALGFEVELVGDTRHMSKREEAADALAAACALVPRINAMHLSGATGDEARRTNRAHVGVARAGLGRELVDSRPPQVADCAVLRGSLRYGPGQTPASGLADLRQLVDETCAALPGITATCRRDDGGDGGDGATMDEPFSVSTDSPVVTAVSSAYRLVRGAEQPTGAIRPYCFYGSDASLLQHLAGMPGVVCGPGGKYNTMPDERVAVQDYLDMIRIHMATLHALCGLSG